MIFNSAVVTSSKLFLSFLILNVAAAVAAVATAAATAYTK